MSFTRPRCALFQLVALRDVALASRVVIARADAVGFGVAGVS